MNQEYTASERRPKSTLSFISNILKPKKKKKNTESFPTTATTLSPHVGSSSASERIIECFCSAIRNITEICTCVGVLVSTNSRHRVWAPKVPLAMLASARAVSLAELLSLPEPPRKERLKLGVRLASSVLQFHRTEWLQERWGKQDIYLIQGDSSQSRSLSLETPVVYQDFSSESSVSGASIESHIVHCNLSLFSLGIVLVELWFWRSVESFQADIPQGSGPVANSDTTRFNIACMLIDKVYGDAGVNYGDIFRRCIKGLDHKEIQLEDEGFKNEVYLKILQPLETHLEVFCNEPLGRIFEK